MRHSRRFGALLSLVLVLCCALIALAGRNYYEVLGVAKDASDRTVKKAYLKLAQELHPDKNKDDPDAAKKFAEVANAYEVLSDKEKRKTYDMHGEEGLKQHNQAASRDPFDLFSQFSGFGDLFGQRRQRQEDQRGDDVHLELQATLEDLYNGKSLEVNVKQQVLCPKCRGSGAKNEDDVKTCPVCKGKGMKTTIHQLAPGFVQQMQSPCDKCGGKGKIASSVCPHCKAAKVVHDHKILDVYIERGTPDGHTIQFDHAADEHPDKQAGHVLFKVVTAPHATFTRNGNDLHYTKTITLLESLVGFSSTVTQLDGRAVKIERDAVTPHGHTMTIKGEGMPHMNNASKKGNMLVHFEVVFPATLTSKQRDAFSTLLR